MGAIFRWVKELWLGRKQLGQIVENTVAYDPAAATVDLFTITGRVRLTSVVGQVTTIIASNAAINANTQLQHTPTTGAAALTPLCLVLDTDTDVVDTLYHITGNVGAALVDDAAAGVLASPFAVNDLILQPGVISMTYPALCTGAIRWTIHYLPIDPGATIVAA